MTDEKEKRCDHVNYLAELSSEGFAICSNCKGQYSTRITMTVPIPDGHGEVLNGETGEIVIMKKKPHVVMYD